MHGTCNLFFPLTETTEVQVTVEACVTGTVPLFT
jgi:hypothetical protein